VARYFLNLVDGSEVLLDPDGIEMPASAVEHAVLTAARDCMAADVKNGLLDLRYRIDVHDESGQLTHRLSFSDAVNILPPN
jgi:uncharacterized protein DUF6894